MNLFELPLSTSLTDVEKTIVRAFLRNSMGPRQPYRVVYAMLARRLHRRIEEIVTIERAMIARVGGIYEEHPVAVTSDNDAVVHELLHTGESRLMRVMG